MTHPPTHPHAAAAQDAFYAGTVAEVAKLVTQHRVVVLGMAWNQPVKKARAWLHAHEVAYHYAEYGNYTNQWKLRLAIKLWAQWPTFPMVFVDGVLVGGHSDLVALEKSGEWGRVYGRG